MRNLDRKLGQICRKITRRLAEGKSIPKVITAQAIEKYLGPPVHLKHVLDREAEVGVATGLAYTETGGDIISIEVAVMLGKGLLTLTGQLGDVMKESVQAALTFAKSHAAEYHIDPVLMEKQDIHLHVPEGATPKDGPSAGITMATALISALSGYKVRPDVAMTGEITLRGRVLPIGGFKEKLMAAHRVGIRTVIVPAKNRKDLSELPVKIQRELTIHFAERMEEVLAVALVRE